NSGPSVANLSEVDTKELDHVVQTNKKNKRGQPKNPLWNYFVEINHQESGHKGWKSIFFGFLLKFIHSYKPPNRKTLSNNWLNYETARITIAIKKELENENNLTLALDSWTSNCGHSYFAFIIIISNKKQYVYSIKNYSINSHTAIFTADEIEKVLINIGIDKFGAVVSDSAFAMSLAKQYISNKYSKILPVQCIAHHIQLICSDIICKTSFGKKVLQQCQSFVIYFHASYQSGTILRNEIINFMINKGGLKSSDCSRWSSAYDCVQSVLNLENCIKQ
ncbi:8014_t:CDS:2, partial [Cetraspora pellucida]